MALKTATKTDTNRVELVVEVDADSFEAAVSKAYKKNIGKMNIPGFRKGKAPRSFVEKIYGSGVFYEDAMNAVYPSALDAAIVESGYEYVEDKCSKSMAENLFKNNAQCILDNKDIIVEEPLEKPIEKVSLFSRIFRR